MSTATAVGRTIGVGIDTARYGHHASFLRENFEHAVAPFRFLESREGYRRLEAALSRVVDRHDGDVELHVRIDAAGQYAVNLQAFLRRLDLPIVVSVGEPKRNRDYKNAHFPKRKSDEVDSLACARFALVERPEPTPEVPLPFDQLRDVAAALDAARKRTTQAVNRLHNQLARVFPELVGEAPDLQANWVLVLLDKHPTPQRIAATRAGTLEKIPRVTPERAGRLRQLAKQSVGALQGPVAERMVRSMVAELRQARRNQRDLLELLCEAYDRLPDGPHRQVQTIGGIGPRTAAALVAKIVSIDRFVSPEKLVGYFGAFPEECSSGVDILGNPKAARHMHMSRKGNDLVRGLLWMAAQTAVRCNPAVRALFKRQLAAGKRGDVALGHCMRKLLHLVFAVWKTDRPFDPDHYPREGGQPRPRPDETPTSETPTSETPTSEGKRDGKRDGGAAGRKGPCPDRKAVTADAAASTPTLARAEPDAKPTAELRPAPAKVATADPADETSALDRSGNGASTGARSAPERPEVEDGSVGETPGPRLPSPRGGVEGPDRSGRPRAGKPSPSCRPRRAADGRRPD